MAIEYDRQEIFDPGEDSESGDEEILFDRTGLLNGKVARRRTRPSRGLNIREKGSWASKFNRLLRTFALCSAFFVLGLCIAVPGPTLLDLQRQVDVSVTQITSIFTARSSGYLIGSLFGGVLFDRYDQRLLLFTSLTWTAIAVGATPWCKAFGALMTAMALMGAGMGFLDTGGNVMCIDMWGEESGPYMQALHFSFGFGAFVAPLLAEPFLAPRITPELNSSTATPSFLDLPKSFDKMSTSHHHRKRDKRSDDGSAKMTLANVSPVNPEFNSSIGIPSSLDLPKAFDKVGTSDENEKLEKRSENDSAVPSVPFSVPDSGSSDKEVRNDNGSQSLTGVEVAKREGDVFPSHLIDGAGSIQNDTTLIGVSGTLAEVDTAEAGVEVAEVDRMREKLMAVPETEALEADLEPALNTTIPIPLRSDVVGSAKQEDLKADTQDLEEGQKIGAVLSEADDKKNSSEGIADKSSSNIQQESASTTATVAANAEVSKTENITNGSSEGLLIPSFNSTVDPDAEPTVPTTLPSTTKRPPKHKPQVNDGTNLDNSVDWNNVKLPNPTPEEVKPTTVVVTNATVNATTTATPEVTTVVDNDTTTNSITTESIAEGDNNKSVNSTGNMISDNSTVSVDYGGATNNTKGSVIIDNSAGKNESEKLVKKDGVEENLKNGNLKNVKGENSTDIEGVETGSAGKNSSEVFAPTESSIEGSSEDIQGSKNGANIEGKNKTDTGEGREISSPSSTTPTSVLLGGSNNFSSESSVVGSLTPEISLITALSTTEKPVLEPSTAILHNHKDLEDNAGYAEGLGPGRELSGGENMTDPDSFETGTEPEKHRVVGRPRVKEELLEQNESTTVEVRSTSESAPTAPTGLPKQRVHYSKPENTYSSSNDDNTYPLDEIAKRIEKYGVTKIHVVYVIIAVLIFHVALMFLCFVCSKPGREARPTAAVEKPVQVGGRVFVFILVSLLSVFFFLYVGMEVAYGQLVMTFSVHSDLHLSKSTGSFITAMFWGSFAAMRFVSIFLARVLKPIRMIMLDFVLVSLGCVALSIGGSTSEPILWIGSAFVGAGMASIFPTGFLWAEQHISVTNKIASAFVVGAAAGEMVCPLVVGLVMENQPMALMHQLSATNVLCIFTFLAAFFLARRRGRRVEAEYEMAQQNDEDELVDFPQLARRLRANS